MGVLGHVSLSSSSSDDSLFSPTWGDLASELASAPFDSHCFSICTGLSFMSEGLETASRMTSCGEGRSSLERIEEDSVSM